MPRRPSRLTAINADSFSTLPVDILRILPTLFSLGDARNLMISSRRFCITDEEEPTNSIFTERYYEHRLREIAGSAIDRIRDAILVDPKPTWQNLEERVWSINDLPKDWEIANEIEEEWDNNEIEMTTEQAVESIRRKAKSYTTVVSVSGQNGSTRIGMGLTIA